MADAALLKEVRKKAARGERVVVPLFSDLSDSDLSDSDLSGSDLRDSNLSGSNLSDSDLRGSDLWAANTHFSNLAEVKWDDTEITAMGLLAKQLTKDQLNMYKLLGSFCDGDAYFSRDELVRTPTGIWCIEIKGDCPPSDRILQRLLLYRHDREQFYKTAERQFC